MRIATTLLVFAAWSRCSLGLVVGTVNGVAPDTTTAPTNYTGWSQGDPGWNNVATSGNYVYLGDGWVLSARHVGYSPTSGIQFQTPSGLQTFYRIPGDYYQDYGYRWTNGDYYYAVANPSSAAAETGPAIQLTQFTDLQLFRINGDPGLPALTISSQPVTNANFNRNNAPQVVTVGGSGGRGAAQTHWNVTQHSQDVWSWWTVPANGAYQGYQSDNMPVKRWGTNRLADIRPGYQEPLDQGAVDFSGIFAGVVSDTTGVLKLQTGDGVVRDILASMTVYDQLGQPGATTYGITNLEAQAIPGDSGSAVFYKRGNQWELAGIVNATYTYPNQPFGTAVFGNATILSDLSYYNKNYSAADKGLGRFSIKDIIELHTDYSIMGDVNLDGVVAGNGTGAPTVDDVAAFISGWNYDNGTGKGTITSWKNGDLNRDGRTNVADFLKLRTALNSQVSSAAVAALLGIQAVPEPTGALLALLAAGWVAAIARRRRAA